MAALQHSLLARLNTTPGCGGELVKSYLLGIKFGLFTSVSAYVHILNLARKMVTRCTSEEIVLV